MIRHKYQTILGAIPSDWGARPLRSLLTENLSGDWGDDEGEVTLSILRSTNFTDSGTVNLADVARRRFSTPKAAKIQVQPHDILVERSGGGPKQPVGRVVMIREPMPETGFANFVQALRPAPSVVVPELLLWTLYQLNKSGFVEKLQHQTTQMRNLDLRDYLKVLLPVPPSGEQTRIAETLKAADDNIRAIEEQIRMADRAKKALMQFLFVYGLPQANAGQQQFRWGMAPMGWNETRLRAVLTEPVGNGISPRAATPEPPGIPTLNVSSIRNGQCDQTATSYIEISDAHSTAFAVRRGDFFVLRGNGNRDYIAIGGLLEEEPRKDLVFSDLLIRVRFDETKANPRFMKYLWQAPSFIRRLQSYAVTGSGLWKIGQRSISRFEFALPDVEEQKVIAKLFGAQEQFADSLTTELTAARRVKQSLLQNLLTGKIRLKS